MLSPSEFNNAVPKFTNGNYANNPVDPQYIEEPTLQDYNRGVEPLETLPAQWWNWLCNQFTSRFNKINTYVKNIFDEITQLLSLLNISPDGTESAITTGQLKNFFKELYPSYVSDKLELGTTYVPQTRTVNGHALTGNITITKSDVGLGNVDNTSDLNKPVSTAQATAISTAINALDVASVGGSGKYLSAISETDGKISATAGDIDSVVTANSNNLITSGGVANAINNLPIDRYTSIFTGGIAQIYHIGRTIGAQSTQAYTNIYFRAGRVDNEYGCGFISIYRNGLIDGKLLLGMQNVSVIFTQIDNEIDMYVTLDSYTGFVFDVAPNSKFTVNIQEVSQIDGNIIWNNAWKLITTTADITNQVTDGDSAAVSSGAVANYAIAKSELVPSASKFLVSNMQDQGYPNIDGTTIFANNAGRTDCRNGICGVSNPTTGHQWPINSASTKDELICLGSLQFYIDKASDKLWVRQGTNIDMGDWYKVLTSNDVTNQITSGNNALVSSGTLYDFFGGNTSAQSWLGKVFGWALGRNWSEGVQISNANIKTVFYGNGVWVAGGNGLYYSTDGVEWISVTGIASNEIIYAVYYANGIWVACTDFNSASFGIYWSEDGINWTASSSGYEKSGRVLYYNNGIWVMGGGVDTSGSGLAWSTDGKTWSVGTGTGLQNCTFNSIYYGNGTWVAGGDNNSIYYSSDGKSWTKTSSTIQSEIKSVFYRSNLWFAVGGGRVYFSINGTTWTLSNYSFTSTSFNSVYNADRTWVICANDGIWWANQVSSVVTWTKAIVTGDSTYDPEFNFVRYANGIWIAGSNTQGLWYSSDGKSWTQSSGSGVTNKSFADAYFANGTWVAGSTIPYYSNYSNANLQ